MKRIIMLNRHPYSHTPIPDTLGLEVDQPYNRVLVSANVRKGNSLEHVGASSLIGVK